MKVLLVYPNDRMDSLISVGVSVLAAHLKAANHQVQIYDPTVYDTVRKTRLHGWLRLNPSRGIAPSPCLRMFRENNR